MPSSKKPAARRPAPKKARTAASSPAQSVDSAKPRAQATSATGSAGDPDWAAAWTPWLQTVAKLQLPVGDLSQVQNDYIRQATEQWNQALGAVSAASAAQAAPAIPSAAISSDRRFASEEWKNNPLAAWAAQIYLLNAQTMMQMADKVEGDAKTKERVRFAVQQWVDAVSPSNFLALNPEAQKLALDTGGQSLTQGMMQLWGDLQQGHMSLTDESRFEIGRNLAVTEGAVVFENRYFQLLQYKPLTDKVFAKPMLLVPPCINKFYILDLQPENSMVRYLVEQGHQVFLVSWRNPDESMAQCTWDEYMEEGVIRAIAEVQAIAGHPGQDADIHTMGFCVGGTMLTTALAVLAGRGRQPAATMTLLTTFLDFSDTGVIDLFVDENMVRMREATMGPDSPKHGGLMSGKDLATTFSFLRPNDLVWNYVVGNYLKGQKPAPFDILYWNSDSTNLPGPWYCWYLRNTYLENRLCKPGSVTVCGVPIDLSLIKADAYLYASREDHIVPWASAFQSTKILKGKTRFVMGASGHVAGVINPASKNKRNYWVGSKSARAVDAQTWLDQAQSVPGSWWNDWSDWLSAHSPALQNAPKKLGDARHPVIEAAPGRYVKVRV